MKKIVLAVCCFFLLSLHLRAQDDSTQSTHKWHLSAGLALVAIPVYHIVGIDTGYTNTLSIAPSVSLSNGGFAISYSPRIITGGSNPGLYMHAVTLGYSEYDKKVFDFAINYSRFFFTDNNSIPYTPLNNEIYTELAYKKLWLKPRIAAGIGFGNNQGTTTASSSSVYDIGVSAGVGHSFDWGNDNTSFSIAPSLLLNAGTNEYFSFLTISKYIGHSSKSVNYVKTGPGSGSRSSGRGGRGGSSGSGSGTGGSTTTTTAQTGKTFDLSNVEFNIESSIDIGSSFSIRPGGSLFIPVGTAAGAGASTYWQLAFQYKF
jgi:hypothetical protein